MGRARGGDCVLAIDLEFPFGLDSTSFKRIEEPIPSANIHDAIDYRGRVGDIVARWKAPFEFKAGDIFWINAGMRVTASR